MKELRYGRSGDLFARHARCREDAASQEAEHDTHGREEANGDEAACSARHAEEAVAAKVSLSRGRSLPGRFSSNELTFFHCDETRGLPPAKRKLGPLADRDDRGMVASMEPSISIDGDRARLPSSVFEHAGFRAWARSGDVPEWLHIAFIDGEVLIEMSPEAIETHNKAKRKITEALGRIVDDEDLGEAYADGVLITHEEARLSTEPDFAFVSWETFEAGRARLVEKANRKDDHIEIEGSPDLVLEVVSDSSVRKDTQLLLDAYRRAGVSEYWLVDARQEISFQVFHLSGGVYRASARDDEPQHSAVLGRTFVLSRAKNRAGRWRYALGVVG